MKNIFCTALFILFAKCILAFNDGRSLNVFIEIINKEITYLEPLPIHLKLINPQNAKKTVYELFPDETMSVEIRKHGEKDWEQINSFLPQEGIMSPLDYFPKYIDISPKDTASIVIGTIPWLKNSQKNYYPYKKSGIYEVRVSYLPDARKKRIYSNITSFKVDSRFDQYNGKVLDYLDTLLVPHFMYSAYYYGNYIKPNNKFSLIKHIEYILSNYPNSNYAAWIKLFLIESDIKSEQDITKKLNIDNELFLLSQSSNPLIKESAEEVIKLVKWIRQN